MALTDETFLPCGSPYHSDHRIGRFTSGLHPCCCHRGGRRFMSSRWVVMWNSFFELMQKWEPKVTYSTTYDILCFSGCLLEPISEEKLQKITWLGSTNRIKLRCHMITWILLVDSSHMIICSFASKFGSSKPPEKHARQIPHQTCLRGAHSGSPNYSCHN